MWDLRGRAKLQMPSTRKTWKATQGQRFAPGLFNLTLPLTPLSYTVHTHTRESGRTGTETYIKTSFETQTSKVGLCQLCSFWNTLTGAWWMQSLLNTPKCPFSKVQNETRWDLCDRTLGVVSYWMWDRGPAALSRWQSRGVRLRFLLRSSSASRVQKWTEDLFSTGSHNQQHLRTVLCNPSQKVILV